ncbi:hypothetical protein QTP88_004629 [Uroleucon formosanum]
MDEILKMFKSENLITHVHGIMNDYRLAVDGIEVRQPRQEFLGYTKHVTPNFGVERPNVHNEELHAHPIEPIIDNIELDLNMIDNNVNHGLFLTKKSRDNWPESPPPFFQGYQCPFMIYAEQDAMPDDIWYQFQEHNDEELNNEIVPYMMDIIEPLVWPTFEFEPQKEIVNPTNDFPHINIRRINDKGIYF